MCSTDFIIKKPIPQLIPSTDLIKSAHTQNTYFFLFICFRNIIRLIMPKAYNCCWCKRRCSGGSELRRRIKTAALVRATEQRIGRAATEEDVICNKCYSGFTCSQTTTAVGIPSHATCSDLEYLSPEPRCSTEGKIKSPKSINLPIASTPKGHRKCVICRNPYNDRNRLVVIPNTAITQAFVETGIFINDDSRCCKMHIDDGYLNREALCLLTTTKQEEQLSRSDICKLLSNLRNTIKAVTFLNFDVPSSLGDEDYVNLTGLKKEQFLELESELKT
jgi:hypothetical protein